jgi:hypothetical protein
MPKTPTPAADLVKATEVFPTVFDLDGLALVTKGLKERIIAVVEDAAESLRAGRALELGELKPSAADTAPLISKYVTGIHVFNDLIEAVRAGIAQFSIEAGKELQLAGQPSPRTGRPELKVTDLGGGEGQLVVTQKLDSDFQIIDTEAFFGLLADEVIRRIGVENPTRKADREKNAQLRAGVIAGINEVLRYLRSPQWSSTAVYALGKVYREERQDNGRAGILERAIKHTRALVPDSYDIQRVVKGGKRIKA